MKSKLKPRNFVVCESKEQMYELLFIAQSCGHVSYEIENVPEYLTLFIDSDGDITNCHNISEDFVSQCTQLSVNEWRKSCL